MFEALKISLRRNTMFYFKKKLAFANPDTNEWYMSPH